MSTDKKEFYRKELNADKTALGAAINSLLRLENRWPSKKEDLTQSVNFLRSIRDTLSEEGHKGYIPTVVEQIVELLPTAVELADELAMKVALDTAEAIRLAKIKEEEEKALKLAEKKRLAEEKAKLVAEAKAKKEVEDKLKAEELAKKKAAKEAKAKEEKVAKMKAELEELEGD